MSLRVWLPLNGNLNNYGTSNTTLETNSGATVNASGKIGSCYYFNNHYISYTCNAVKSFTECSVCLWMKMPTTHSTWAQVCTLGTSGTSWNNILLGIDINSNGVVIGNVSNGSTYINCNSNIAIKDDIWHHLCFTYTSGTSKIYIDGVLKATQALSITPNFNGVSNVFVGGNSGGERLTGGYINDYRVYDHCLSTSEVKEIAKGLVVHYNLDGLEVETTTNLVTSLTAGGQTSISNGVVTTSGINADTYFTINLSESIVVGTTYTLSCDASGLPNNVSWGFPMGWQGNTGLTMRIYNGHNEYTFTANSGDWGTNRLFMDDNNSSEVRSSGNITKIYNFQLEKKNHATGYIGPGGSRTAPIVKDSSGYNNNGTPSGDATRYVAALVPRHESCVYLHSTNVGTSTPTGAAFIRGTLKNSITPNAFSVSWWANITNYSYQESGIMSLSNSSDYPSDYQTSTLVQYDSKFQINGSGSASLSSTDLITTGSWHHYALTYNGSTYKSYRDGTLIASTSFSGTLASMKYIYLGINVAGGAYRQTTGYWSDFKLYVTALSAEDVSQEYHTYASIYNNQTLKACEFIEPNANLLEATNTSLTRKSMGSGLSSYTQSNCSVTLTDNGYRIYRAPNLTPSTDGNTMWGGLVIKPYDIYGRDILVKGHTYILKFRVSGQSSNDPEFYWTNQCGWGGGGLEPEPSDVSYQMTPSNFQGEMECFYKWTINDDVWKVCTSSYSVFVAGNTYLSYRDFKYGFNYTNTGSLGTDLYITDIRMYDITAGNVPVKISTKGVCYGNLIEENFDKVSFNQGNEVFAKQFIEV